jgi:hypothetical protein
MNENSPDRRGGGNLFRPPQGHRNGRKQKALTPVPTGKNARNFHGSANASATTDPLYICRWNNFNIQQAEATMLKKLVTNDSAMAVLFGVTIMLGIAVFYAVTEKPQVKAT